MIIILTSNEVVVSITFHFLLDAFREPLLSFTKRHKVSSSDVTSNLQLGSSSESLATLSARLRKISGTVSDADSSQGRYSVGLCATSTLTSTVPRHV